MLAYELMEEGPFNTVLELSHPKIRQCIILDDFFVTDIVNNLNIFLFGSFRDPSLIAEDIRINLFLEKLHSFIADDVLLFVELSDCHHWKQTSLLHTDCTLKIVHHLFLGVGRKGT